MAGKYIEFVNPGYSTLYTRDLQFSANTTRDPNEPVNPFNPDAVNPLLEGEWLEMAAGNRVQRGATGSAGAGYNVATSFCLLHFSERGRYDAQITKKAHLISGPSGFTFTTKLCSAGDWAVGDKCLVADIESPVAAGKFVRGLMPEDELKAASKVSQGDQVFMVGVVTRDLGDNYIEVQYMPQMTTVA